MKNTKYFPILVHSIWEKTDKSIAQHLTSLIVALNEELIKGGLRL